MKIVQLKTHGLRNLCNIDIAPASHFNLFYGVNGSGKTSLLESIYLLGFGRSFRSSQVNTLIHYQSSSFATFAQMVDNHENNHLIGFEKNRQARLKLKMNGEPISSVSQIAQLCPMQVLCPDSFQLLTAGPEGRRQFLDWGVFHVEPSFFAAWVSYTRALRQRNILLRDKRFDISELGAWNEELVRWGELLTLYRKQYIQDFIPKLEAMLDILLPLSRFEMGYEQGWPQMSLKEALESGLAGDLKMGYTRMGPQRADLIFKIYESLAGQILSRGQQKLFVCALILAQGALILEKIKKPCIYLIDDLAAELDSQTRRRVIEQMALSGSQLFITGIEPDFLKEGIKGFDHKMFHVEHGQILG